jgi:DNA-binding response OmpR family regulator
MGASVPSAVILLVDDEYGVREEVGEALRSRGFSVLEASGYEQALEIFQAHGAAVDLLITNISLPSNNGFELASRIAAVRPQVKQIFASGKAGRELCKFYYMTEADPRLLDKPFKIEELIERVQVVLKPDSTAQPG